MKIKFLPLILLIIGALAASGCIDSQAQPSNVKAPGDLYRSIFYPYAGLLKGDYEPGVHIIPHDPLPNIPAGEDPSRSLRAATLLLDENIIKAEAISARLEPGIQYLRDQGKDVSRLESLLEEYNGLVEEAKKYRALAASSEEYNSTGTDGYSEDELPAEDIQKEYLIQSQKSMIRANLVLKDIFEEFKLLMPGNIELNETEKLNAAGEGRVILIGDFDLNLQLQEGEMAVMDLSQDSRIKIKGNYLLEVKEGRPEKIFVYHIKSADLEISGSRKTLLLNGENITVEAEGKGYAAFFGNGTYIVEDVNGTNRKEQWAINSFFDEQMMQKEPDKKENRTPLTGMHDPKTGIIIKIY